MNRNAGIARHRFQTPFSSKKENEDEHEVEDGQKQDDQQYPEQKQKTEIKR